MNKVIPSNSRIFMAVVGPSGCGKSELIFRMLHGKTFNPAMENIYYFYRESQPLYNKTNNTLNIQTLKIVFLYSMTHAKKYITKTSL